MRTMSFSGSPILTAAVHFYVCLACAGVCQRNVFSNHSPWDLVNVAVKLDMDSSYMVKIADSEIKRALFIGNQLGLVSVYTSVESDKKSFGLVLSDFIYH